MNHGPFTLNPPQWVADYLRTKGFVYSSPEDRMMLVIDLARLNVAHGTGGPFGAAVFEAESGRFISAGVNLVVSAGCSVLHAEIVALILAQRICGTFDLGAPDMPSYELAASTEPCAMCLGAIPWSGVRRLLCGARSEDAEAVGFDEGDKPAEWVAALNRRGIEVVQDCCRARAAAMLRIYSESGGIIYNSRRGG